MEKTFGRIKLQLELSDITKLKVDAVVNAANPSLMGGGGVDGAIHRVGGPSILQECKAIVAKMGKLHPGKAVVTTGGRLPARYVIHTVGPIWRGGQQREAEILSSAYRESLTQADHMAVKSLAFPSISTGAYGYPIGQAADIALTAIRDYATAQETGLENVVITLISRDDLRVYEDALKKF